LRKKEWSRMWWRRSRRKREENRKQKKKVAESGSSSTSPFPSSPSSPTVSSIHGEVDCRGRGLRIQGKETCVGDVVGFFEGC
jgi:hypothetical protein